MYFQYSEMKDSPSIDIENYLKPNNTKMPETAHLTESRRDKAFRGFRNVVGAGAANAAPQARQVKVKQSLQ